MCEHCIEWSLPEKLMPLPIYIVGRNSYSQCKPTLPGEDIENLCHTSSCYPYFCWWYTYVQVHLLTVFSISLLTIMLRLYIIYPPKTTTNHLLTIILTPLILSKILRITNSILFIVKFGKVINSATPGITVTPTESSQVLSDSPYPKIEYFMQIFDNWYVS